MAVQTLTAAAVKSLAPVEGKQIEVIDQKSRGLGIRVSPGGTKTWFLIYKSKGRQRRHSIGRYPTLSLSDAREKADELRLMISKGGDPADDRAALRNGAFPFDKFIDFFIETYSKPRNRAWAESERILRRNFECVWRSSDIRHITKADVVAVIDKISKTRGPSAANQAFAHVRKLFNWAKERGHIETSSCEELRQPHPAKSCDRVLSDDELAAIWHAAEGIGYPFGPFVQLLTLTGQRRSEVASMRWEELDFAGKVWRLPRGRTKADRAHDVPLSPRAIAVLKNIPKYHDTLVFPARNGNGNAISGFSKWKEKFDQRSGITGWTIHDIRRTAASGMARLKVPPHVIERVQNRVTGKLGGAAGIYNRYGYLDEMREALTVWSQHVDDILKD